MAINIIDFTAANPATITIVPGDSATYISLEAVDKEKDIGPLKVRVFFAGTNNLVGILDRYNQSMLIDMEGEYDVYFSEPTCKPGSCFNAQVCLRPKIKELESDGICAPAYVTNYRDEAGEPAAVIPSQGYLTFRTTSDGLTNRGQFGIQDVETGLFNILKTAGVTTQFYNGLAISADETEVYFTEFTNYGGASAPYQGLISWTYDVASGTFSSVPFAAGDALEMFSPSAGAVNPIDGKYYLLCTYTVEDAHEYELMEFDPVTGVGTWTGIVLSPLSGNVDIEFDADGTLYYTGNGIINKRTDPLNPASVDTLFFDMGTTSADLASAAGSAISIRNGALIYPDGAFQEWSLNLTGAVVATPGNYLVDANAGTPDQIRIEDSTGVTPPIAIAAGTQDYTSITQPCCGEPDKICYRDSLGNPVDSIPETALKVNNCINVCPSQFNTPVRDIIKNTTKTYLTPGYQSLSFTVIGAGATMDVGDGTGPQPLVSGVAFTYNAGEAIRKDIIIAADSVTTVLVFGMALDA